MEARTVISIADVHARTLPDRFKALQHLDAIGAIFGWCSLAIRTWRGGIADRRLGLFRSHENSIPGSVIVAARAARWVKSVGPLPLDAVTICGRLTEVKPSLKRVPQYASKRTENRHLCTLLFAIFSSLFQ
jgi:hypothetical protein